MKKDSRAEEPKSRRAGELGQTNVRKGKLFDGERVAAGTEQGQQERTGTEAPDN